MLDGAHAQRTRLKRTRSTADVWLMEKTMLPRAVQEQADRAEAAHQASLNTAAPAAQEVVEVVAPVVVAPEPVHPAPVAPAEPPVVPAVDSWELKYKVLEGKYRAEVPRLAEELRQERAKNAARPAATPVAEPTADATPAMTPESVASTYGDDFAAAVEAVAESKLKGVREQVASIEVQGVERARSDFLRELGQYVPNFLAIDAEPGFTAFLDEFDPLTNRSRREFFSEADRTNNAARVAGFFAAYSKSKSPAPVQAPAAEVPNVDHLIAPDSSRSSEAPPGKKFWTRAEVKQFYVDARTGKFTPSEYARIESDIFAAQAENRLGS